VEYTSGMISIPAGMVVGALERFKNGVDHYLSKRLQSLACALLLQLALLVQLIEPPRPIQ
jgi:hypothetical protein